MEYKLKDIISVQPGFKAVVNILLDLNNEEKIGGYIPTENGVRIIEQAFAYLEPFKASRPLITTGTYGTGKSHLGLVITSMLNRTQDNELFQILWEKINSKWQDKAKKVKNQKENLGDNPYLFVYLEGEEIDFGAGFMNNSLILGLKKALQRQGLEDLTPETAYDSAIKRIEGIKGHYPEAYSILEKETLAKGYYSVEHLIAQLGKHSDKKVLDDFRGIHPKASAGAPFEIFANMPAGEVYKSTAESLRKRGYGGILLIWDEFTPIIRKLVEDPMSGEALSFQKFAETCEGSGRDKVIFITISHRTVEEVIDIVARESYRGESIIKDAEKISGRFRPMSLGLIDKETYHLMSGIINHKKEMYQVKQLFNERFLGIRNSLEKANLFPTLSTEERQNLVEGLYPLHPFSTFVLSQLTDRVGQRERTIFTYLCDSGEGGFYDFLENEMVTEKSLPFIYPCKLVDYFLPIMETNQDFKEIRRIAKKYQETILGIDPQDNLAHDLLKTIMLLNAVSIPATDENLLFALGVSISKDKEALLFKVNQLKEQKILTKRISDGSWRFFGQGLDVAMEEHLKETVKELEGKFSVKELFNKALSSVNVKAALRSISAEEYNTERDTMRKLDLSFISTKELDNPESLRKPIEEDFLDGKYYLVLGDTEKELEMTVEKLGNNFRNDTNILFALPINPRVLNEIIPQLKKLQALELLPEHYPEYKTTLREELISEKDDVKNFLKTRLDEFLDPLNGLLHFYFKGERIEISALNQLKRQASQMMEETFPYTPPIPRGELINDSSGDTLKRYRIPLIDTVLSPDAPRLLIHEKDTTKEHLVEAVYKMHNILRQEKGKWIIGKPSSSPHGAMVKVWEKIDGFVTAQIPQNFPDLINKLMLPPYGLKIRTIGMILAAAIRNYILDNNLILEWKSQPVEKIDGKLIEENIVIRQQKITVRYQEITEKHKRILKGLINAFNLQYDNIDSIYKDIVNWWRELPAYSRNTQKITEEQKKIRDNFFSPLSTGDRDKKELFYSSLPDLLGLHDLSKVTEEEIEKHIERRMTEVKFGFENIFKTLQQEIKEAIIGVWREEKELIDYYSKLPQETTQAMFTGDAKRLIDWLKQVDQKKIIEINDCISLAENVLGKSENWNDEQVIKLKGHIESAKNQLDSFVPHSIHPKVREEPDITDFNGIEERQYLIIKKGNSEILNKVFFLYEELDRAPNAPQAKIIFDMTKNSILPTLKNGQITGDEFMSILYKLIIEAYNA